MDSMAWDTVELKNAKRLLIDFCESRCTCEGCLFGVPVADMRLCSVNAPRMWDITEEEKNGIEEKRVSVPKCDPKNIEGVFT